MRTMPGPIPSFHAWDDDPKTTLWNLFLDRYEVHKDANPNKCREVMEKIAATGYGRTLTTARDECKEKYGWDTNKWKSMVPDWCLTAEHWYGLCDYYGTAEFRKVSDQNKKNRGTNVTHHAGSASGVKHFQILKKRLDRDPTQTELWLEIHAPKVKSKKVAAVSGSSDIVDDNEDGDASQDDGSDGEGGDGEGTGHHSTISEMVESLDPASRAIYDKVQEMKQDPQHEGKPEALLFYIAYGGRSHGRVPGFGNKIDESIPKESKKRARASHYVDSSVSNVTEESEQRMFSTADVKQLLQQQAEFFADKWAQRDERDKEKDSRYERRFQYLFDTFGMKMPDETIIDQPSDDQQDEERVQGQTDYLGDTILNQQNWGNAFFTNLLASQQ